MLVRNFVGGGPHPLSPSPNVARTERLPSLWARGDQFVRLTYKPVSKGTLFGVLSLMIAFGISGCSGDGKSGNTKPTPVTPVTPVAAVTGTTFEFVDVQDSAGVKFKHTDGSSGRHYFIEQIGAGCAFVDYDNDGLLDIFVINGAPLPGYKGPPNPHSELWHNLGNGKFENVTEKSGLGGMHYGHGVCAGDFDNDGLTDLYVTCSGHNHLYKNMGNGNFVDNDNDGKLDLYVCGYVDWNIKADRWCGKTNLKKSYCGPEVYPARRDTLYHNNGDGTFTDVTVASGIAHPRSKSLGVVASDVNNDGWPDFYVANDLDPNLLFINNGKGKFTEQGVQQGVAFSGDGASEASMGVVATDYDNDGKMDLFVTNYSFEMCALYRNTGSNFFTYESNKSGVGPPTLITLAFGTRFEDFDNDGWQDVVVGNGHVLDDVHEQNEALEYAQAMQLMRNRGGKFEEITKQAGPSFVPKYVARGLATGDFDNDGKVDMLVNDMNGPLRLIHNQIHSSGHWLTLQLVGTRSNRSAIGAHVTITTKTGTQTQEVVSGSSFLSQSDFRLHFGLGDDTATKDVTVRWPGSGGKPGQVEVWKALAVDKFHKLTEGAARQGEHAK
jgi:hypothetical protein